MNNFKCFSILILTSFFLTACSDCGSKTEVNQLTDDTFDGIQSETSINNSLQEEKSTSENNANEKESISDNCDITKKPKIIF
jgi:outer membrane biogenesis lipoprotein LolB